MADIFSIVSDPTRRHLLGELLDSGEKSVSELVAALELSQPTVSKHLKVLRDSGLVIVRDEGQHRYYRLNAEPLSEIESWIIPFLERPVLTETIADATGQVKDVVTDVVREGSALGRRVGRSVAEFASRLR